MARIYASTLSFASRPMSVQAGTIAATIAMICVLAAVIAGAHQAASGAPLLTEDMSWLMFTSG